MVDISGNVKYALVTIMFSLGLALTVAGCQALTPTPGSTAPPPPTMAPAVSGQVVEFPISGSQSQFLALMNDMSIDVIEMEPGTYRGWHLSFNVDRTARPLTIRPAAGGTVTFDDAGGTTQDGLFYPGWGGYTAHITFDGPFRITNYNIGDTGVIATAWAVDLTFDGFSVSGTLATSATDSQNAFVVYVSSDGTHRGENLTFDDWTVDNTASDSSIAVSALQLYHSPQVHGLTALHWTVIGGYWGFVGRGDATGVDIEDWTISGTSGPAFDSEGPAGIVKDVHASNSGAPEILSPMVNGGGNVW